MLHDAAGNQTQDAQGRQYFYNDAGRLTAIQSNGQTLAEYRYNANGQRTHKTANNTTTLYHYDRQDHLVSESQADGTPLRDYLWHGDTPIAQIDRQNGADSINYLHTDYLNTPRVATSPSQSVTWRWEGDAFGQTLPQSFGATVNLRFPGQYFDQESGLHYNWERYYDSRTGRYISSDPIGLDGGLNTYSYVYNNPLKYVDPLGLEGKIYYPVPNIPTIPGTPSYNLAKSLTKLFNSSHDDSDESNEPPPNCPPKRVTNPKHHRNSNSPEPENVDDLFDKSISDREGRRWAQDEDGVIHRFSKPSNGETHWNGSTAGENPIRSENIPVEIRRQLR